MTAVQSEIFKAGTYGAKFDYAKKNFSNFVHLERLWNFMIKAYFSIFKIEKKRSKTEKIKHPRVVSYQIDHSESDEMISFVRSLTFVNP